jgi:hypothetical protein
MAAPVLEIINIPPTMVVRLIAIYDVPRVKFKTSKNELRKVQRMACLSITAAMKTSSWG